MNDTNGHSTDGSENSNNNNDIEKNNTKSVINKADDITEKYEHEKAPLDNANQEATNNKLDEAPQADNNTENNFTINDFHPNRVLNLSQEGFISTKKSSTGALKLFFDRINNFFNSQLGDFNTLNNDDSRSNANFISEIDSADSIIPNRSPIVFAIDNQFVDEDGAAVTGSFVVTDADSTDSHSFTVLTQPTEGVVINHDDGTFSFNPGSDFQDLAEGETRSVTFTYAAVDDSGAANATSVPATVTMTVTGSNDRPSAQVVAVTATEDGAAVTGSFVVTDADSTDNHSFTVLTQPTEGVVINHDDGTFSFNPGSDFQDLAEGETRSVTFTYAAVDDSGAANATSVPATVTMTVTGSNDRPSAQVVAVTATEDGAAVTGSFVVTDADSTDSHSFTVLTQPTEGVVINHDDGTFSFNPGSDFQDLAEGETRSVTFTYAAVDDSGAANATSVPATVTMTVTGSNDQPSAQVVALAATEDGAAVTGSFVVTDADSTDSHSFTVLTQPTEGVVINHDDGTFSFNPGSDFQDLAEGETRSVTFTYAAVDDSGAANATSVPTTVTMTVTGSNDRPSAQVVAVTATEDGAAVTGSFVVTDADSTDNHSFTVLTQPTEGVVINHDDGTFSFNPGSDFQDLAEGETRSVTFTYAAVDDSGAANATSVPATVTMTVTGSNDRPSAQVVAVTATEDGAAVTGSFVVTDADSTDSHSFTVLTQPTEGVVINHDDGTFSFNPGSDFQDLAEGETRSVTFTYAAVDDSGAANATSVPATVTMTVTGSNDQPSAQVVALAATEDGAAVTGSFVVTDADSTDSHSFTVLTQPTEGVVINHDDGTFSFNPGSDFQDLAEGETRSVTFTYAAVDDSGAANATSVPATVTMTVTGSNDRPSAQVVAVTATEDGAAVTGSFVVTDADSTDSHSFTVLTQPTEGVVINHDDGTFSFNPGSDFQDLAEGETRSVTFTYAAVDDSGAANATSVPATVTMTVTGSNDQPSAQVVALAATEDGAAVTGSFVVTDADSTDSHSFTVLTQPTEGVVINHDDGTFSFNPGSDFQDLAEGETRSVTFTYAAVDDSGAANATSVPATVTMTVTGSNDRPSAQVVAVTATEDGAAVTGSFVVTDADSTDSHSFTVLTQPTEGVVINHDDGTFSFNPGSDFQDLAEGETRSVTFTYAAVDDSGAANATSVPATVTMTVTGSNDRPSARVVAVTATEDGAAVTGSFVVTDADSTDSHSFTVLTQPTEGVVINHDDGTFSFNPGSDFQDLAEGETRSVTFTYAAVDDSGAANATSVPTTVTMTVTGSNDRPSAQVVAVTATEDGAAVTGSFVVTDADSTDNHSFTVLTQPTEGVVINHDDGTFSFNPGSDFQDLAEGETRSVTFTYAAVDDSGAANATSVPATVTMTVTGSNDRPSAQVVAVTATEDGAAVTGSFVVTDADSTDSHSFTVLTQPTEGVVINHDDGTFSFNPGSDFQDLAEGETRSVTFTYAAVDDSGAANATSVPATVTMTVTGSNDQPSAQVVALAATEDGAAVTGSFVVTDADSTDSHSFTVLTQPTEGVVINHDDGTFSFNPGSDFQDLAEGETRSVTFTYAAVDDSGAANATSVPATVTMTVTGSNDRPSAQVVAVTATEDGAAVTGSFVVTDADSTDSHSFTVLTQPTEGVVINHDDGTFSFNPGSDFQDLAEGETRSVTFTYAAVDDSGAANATSVPATVTMTVTGSNDQPSAQVVALAATEDGAAVTGSFVVTDADSTDSHSFTVLTQPTEGVVINHDDGTFSFNPGSDFQDLAEGETRSVTFTYAAVDDSGAANATSVPATVTMTVTGSNDRPSAQVVAVTATEDGAAVTGSFVVTDADSTDSHSFTVLTQPTEGVVINHDDGTFSFNPGSDFQDLAEGETRSVTFTYAAVDDSGAANATSVPATVTMTVTGSNDRPSARVVAVTATEDGAAVTGSFVVTDADSTDSHSFTVLTQPTEGVVINHDDGTFSFNPGSDFQDLAEGETRSVTFTYAAVDDSGAANATSVPATVTMTVTGSNDRPSAQVVAVTVIEDGAAVTGSFVVTDADSTDNHSFTVLTQPTDGAVINHDDGTFSFNPGSDFQDLAEGETRSVTFTYAAVDDSGAANATSVPATVTMTVTGKDDVEPTIQQVFLKTPGYFKTGDSVEIIIKFSEDVNLSGVDLSNPSTTPSLQLSNGEQAYYQSGDGSDELMFIYTVGLNSSENTLALNYQDTNALVLPPSVMMYDDFGNMASLLLPDVEGSNSLLADGITRVIDIDPPVIEGFSVLTANGSYFLGDIIQIAVHMNETVFVENSPILNLSNGGQATYQSGSGSNTILFNYEIQAGESAPNLDVNINDLFSFTDSNFSDAAGNLINNNNQVQLIDLQSDLQAYWNFDNVSNIAIDKAPNDAIDDVASLVSGASIQPNGFKNNAVSLDGSNDHVRVKSSGDINKYSGGLSLRTISLAFKVDPSNALSGRQVLFEEGGSTNGLNIYIKNGELYVGAWSRSTGWKGNFLQQDISGLDLNEWHHTALVLDAADNTMKGYLDGQEFASGAAESINSHSAPIGIGGIYNSIRYENGYTPGSGGYFHGMIDEVRVYDRALTTAEIDKLAGGETSLVYPVLSGGSDISISDQIADINENQAPQISGSSYLVTETDSGSRELGLTISDNENDSLTIQVKSLPQVGSLTLSDDTPIVPNQFFTLSEFQGIKYQAPAEYDGTSPLGSFNFTIDDGQNIVHRIFAFDLTSSRQTIDFENYTPTTLSEQQGWVLETINTNDEVYLGENNSFDGSSAITFSSSANNAANSGTLLNSSKVLLPDMSSAKAVSFELDLLANTTGTTFGVGYDENSDGRLSQSGELAFSVTVRPDINEFQITTADGNTHSLPIMNAENKWFKVKLEADLAADNEVGAVTLSYKNLSDGDTEWITPIELDNLPIGLNSSAVDETNSENWNGIFFNMGDGGAIDNIAVGVVEDINSEAAASGVSTALFASSEDDIIQGSSTNDTLTGGDGQDQFLWVADDLGQPGSPAVDEITDFNVAHGGDIIDLSNFLPSEASDNLEDFLDINIQSGNTEISVRPSGTGGDITQKIILKDVDLSSIGNEASILNTLLQNGNLHVDG